MSNILKPYVGNGNPPPPDTQKTAPTKPAKKTK
jgi:hypothetical protein